MDSGKVLHKHTILKFLLITQMQCNQCHTIHSESLLLFQCNSGYVVTQDNFYSINVAHDNEISTYSVTQVIQDHFSSINSTRDTNVQAVGHG